MDDPDEGMRRIVATALIQLGQGEPSIIDDLLKRLDSENELVRTSASFAIGWLAHGNPEATSTLLRRLDDKRAYVRASAADALRWVQPVPLEVEAALERLAKNDKEEEKVRFSAYNSLYQLKGRKSGTDTYHVPDVPVPMEDLIIQLEAREHVKEML